VLTSTGKGLFFVVGETRTTIETADDQTSLKQHRERSSLLTMKVGVFIDEGDVVLVQFTSSFAVLLG